MKNKQVTYIILPALGVGLIIILIAVIGSPAKTDPTTAAINVQKGERLIGKGEMNAQGMSDKAPSREAPEWKELPEGKGIKYWELQPGEGEETVKAGEKVIVKYIGWRARDGEFFDGNTTKPDTFTVEPGRVIKGWQLGLVGMKPGEIRRLLIPSELAYGATGSGDKIPPYADLIFEIKMLRIIRKD